MEMTTKEIEELRSKVEKELKIKRNLSTNYNTITFSSDKYPGEYEITIYPSPTGNCQLFSISTLHSICDMKNRLKPDVTVLEILQYISYFISGKTICLLDVKSDLFDSVKVELDAHIINTIPYVSSNGSNMVIILLNLRNKK